MGLPFSGSPVAGRRASLPYEPMPLRFEQLAHAEQRSRSALFLESMSARRSCRFFSDQAVDEELVINAIRTAGTAPSGANQQPWTFVLVADPAIKAAIRAAAEAEERDLYENGPEEWLAALAPLGTDAVKAHLTDAPFVIVVFAHVHGLVVDEAMGSVERTKHYYVRESVGIACGLLLASLTYAGLATLPHTPSSPRFLASILGRPSNERAEMVIPVGMPAPGATVPRHALQKKALGEILVRR